MGRMKLCGMFLYFLVERNLMVWLALWGNDLINMSLSLVAKSSDQCLDVVLCSVVAHPSAVS